MQRADMRDIDRILAEQSAELLESLKRNEPGSRERLASWLSESRRHVEHYLMMVALDRELEFIDSERKWDIAADAAGKPETVVPLVSSGTAIDPPSTRKQRSPRFLVASMAASIVLAVSVLITRYVQSDWREFSTTVGEQRAIELEDGSLVHLNTQSRVQVRFSQSGRDIRLLSGEALFKVHRDALRPFRVLTADAVIQAVGTEFNVYRRPEGTVVSVLEGRVRVVGESLNAPEKPASGASEGLPEASKSTRMTSLDAGQQARVDHAGRIAALPAHERDSFAAWRQRRLIFKSTPLEEMISEFNRYNRVPTLKLQESARGERVFSGIFDADDPESLIELLEGEPGLAVQRSGDNVVIRVQAAKP